MLKFDGQFSGFWCVMPPSWSVCCCHRSTDTGKVVNYHLTGGGQEIVDFTNYASHVCRSGPIYANHGTWLWKPSNIKNNYAGPLESLASADVKYFLPSTSEVIIDHVPSLGRAVTTANWSTWRHQASKSAILAVKFQHFVKLTCWKLNV